MENFFNDFFNNLIDLDIQSQNVENKKLKEFIQLYIDIQVEDAMKSVKETLKK